MKIKKVISFLVVTVIMSSIVMASNIINSNKIKVSVYLDSKNDFTGQLFYKPDVWKFRAYFQDVLITMPNFNEQQSVASRLEGGKLEFVVPTNKVKALRIDLGSEPGLINIKKIIIHDKLKTIELNGKEILDIFNKQMNMEIIKREKSNLEIFSAHVDPYLYMDKEIDYKTLLWQRGEYNLRLIFKNIGIGIIISAILWYLFKRMKVNLGDINKIGFVGTIIFILCAPYFCSIFGISIMENTEQRTQSIKPQYVINESDIGDYIKEYENYFNDSYGLRDTLIWVNNLLHKKVFNVSPIEKVTLGKDEWLFYAGDKKNTELMERGVKLYSESQLNEILIKLEEKKNYLKRNGSEFILFIPPNKETIYNEFLPDDIRKVSQVKKIDQVIEYVRKNSDIRIVDVRDTLKNAKDVEQLYYKTDTHWNSFGAYFAYRELMSEINKVVNTTEAYSLENFEITKYSFDSGGDLARMLSLSEEYSDDYFDFKLKKGSQAENINYVSGKGNTVISRNIDQNLPKLLMFRDSFTCNLGPFLSEHFSESVYSWDYKINKSLVEEHKPDVVILEVLERFIDELTLENPEGIR